MSSLLSLSYCAIKNPSEKLYASDITVGQSVKICDDSHILLQSKTLQKHIRIDLSDRMGSNITFTLQKKIGKIILSFHKKHSFYCTIMFKSHYDQLLDLVTYKSKCLRNLLVEIVLNDFPFACRSYLENGMRKKSKIVKQLVTTLLQCDSSLNILCEVNDVCIVNITQ